METEGSATVVFTKANAFNTATFANSTKAIFAKNTSITTLDSNGGTIQNTDNLTVEHFKLHSNVTVLDNTSVTVSGGSNKGLDGRGGGHTGNLELQNNSRLTIATGLWTRANMTVTVDSTSTFALNSFAISGVDADNDAVVTFGNASSFTDINSATSMANAAINYTGTEATLSSTLTNSTLTHSGNGTLTLTGNTGSGAISVATASSVLKLQHSAATTTANAITYELGGGLQTGESAETVGGKVLVKDGTLKLSGDGTLTLNELVTGSTGVISNTGTAIINSLDLATTLTNTGTLTIDATHLTIDTWGLTHFDTVGEGGSTYHDNVTGSTTSGFASGSYIIIKSTGGGTLTVTNPDNLEDLGLAVNGNNIEYGNASDMNTYVVNDNLTYSTTQAYQDDSLGDVTLRVTTDKTLTVDRALVAGTKVEVNDGGILKITADNALASADAKFDAGSKLNIEKVGDNAAPTLTLSGLNADDRVAITLSGDGSTLVLTGNSSIDTDRQSFDFGSTNTHLEFDGATTLNGNLVITDNTTGNQHLQMRVGSSITLADDASLTYANDIFAAKAGAASMISAAAAAEATNALTPGESTQTFENLAITLGGTSGETRTIDATLTGSDVTARNANFTFGTNVASLTSFNAATAGTVTFNGDIAISGTTTTGANAATFNGTANLAGDASFGGTSTFTGAATLGGDATFTGKATFTAGASITGATTISQGASFSGETSFGGNVSIAGNSSFAGETSFNGPTVTIKTGTEVNANSVIINLADGSDVVLEAGASLVHDGFTYSVASDAAQSGTIHKVDNVDSQQSAGRFSAFYSDGATLSDMTVTQDNTDKYINMSFSGVDYVNKGGETRLMGGTNNFNSFKLGQDAAGTLYIKSDVYMTGRLTLANAKDKITMDADKSLTVSNGKIQLTGRHGIADASEVVTVTNANSTISGEHTDGLTIKNVNVFIESDEASFTWSAKVDDDAANVTNTGTGAVVMTADNTLGTLTVNHGELTLSGTNKASGVVASPSGTLSLAETGSVAMGAVTLKNGSAAPASGMRILDIAGDGDTGDTTPETPVAGGTMQNVTANATSIDATDANLGHGTMDNVYVSLDAAGTDETPYTISHVDLTNSLVELKNASKVTMEDVTIGAGTRIANVESSSTLGISNSTLVMTQTQGVVSGASANPAVENTVALTSYDMVGATLSNAFSILLDRSFMEQLADVAGLAKLDTLEITLLNVANAADLVGTNDDNFFTVTSGLGDYYGLEVNNVSAVYTGETISGLVLSVAIDPAIPEPATGALSVLALAALAARRRRK